MPKLKEFVTSIKGEYTLWMGISPMLIPIVCVHHEFEKKAILEL